MTPFEQWVVQNLPNLRQIQSQGAYRPRPAPQFARQAAPPRSRARRAASSAARSYTAGRDPLEDWFRSVSRRAEQESAGAKTFNEDSPVGGALNFLKDDVFGKGLAAVLNTVDIPRAGYAAIANQARQAGVPSILNYTPLGMIAGAGMKLEDVLSEPENWQETLGDVNQGLRSDFNRRIGYREASGLNEIDLGPANPLKGIVGFAGDVLYDPTLVVGAAPSVAKGAGVGLGRAAFRGGADDVLSAALRTGSRKDLATALGRTGMEAGERASQNVLDPLAAAARGTAGTAGPGLPNIATVDWDAVGRSLAARQQNTARSANQARSIAEEIGAEFSLQAGRRGRGAVTRRGVRRSLENLQNRGLRFTGTPEEIARSRAALGLTGDAAELTADDLVKIMGLDLKFGYGFAPIGGDVASSRLAFSGLAEMRENVFGYLKLSASDLPWSQAFRQIVNTTDFNYNVLIDNLIRGAADVGGKYDADLIINPIVGEQVISETAERQLGTIQAIGDILNARAASRAYAHNNAQQLLNDLVTDGAIAGSKISRRGPRRGVNLSKQELDRIRVEMDENVGTGTLSSVAQVLRRTLDKVYDDLVAAGVRLPYRKGYLPHVLSQQGERYFKTFDEDQLIRMGVERRATFSMPRTWEAGKDMFFPDGTSVTLRDGTIDEINGLWREWGKRNGMKNAEKFTLLNEDPLDIVSGYIAQAAEQIGRQSIINRVAGRNKNSWVLSTRALQGAQTQAKATRAAVGTAERQQAATLEETAERVLPAARAAVSDDELKQLADAQKYATSERRAKEKGLVDLQTARESVVDEMDRVSKYRSSLKAKKGGFTNAARASRRAANRRAADLDAQADAFQSQIELYERRIKNMERLQKRKFTEARQAEIDEANAAVDALKARVDEDRLAAKDLRESMTAAEADSVRLVSDIEQLDLRFGLLEDKLGKVDSRIAFETSSLEVLSKRLDQVTSWLDTLAPPRSPAGPTGRQGRVISRLSSDKKLREQQVEILLEHAQDVRRLLNDPDFQGVFGKKEAQRLALEAELDARILFEDARNVRLKREAVDLVTDPLDDANFRVIAYRSPEGRKRAEARAAGKDDPLAAMDDEEFIQMMRQKLKDDFVAWTDEYDIPKDLLKQYEVEFEKYSTWFELWLRKSGASTDAIRGALRIRDWMRAAMNWWKSWAVGSPGFVSRNLQGGLFNMFLDGVDVESFRLFAKTYRAYARGDIGDDLWRDRAIATLSRDRAVRRAAAQNGTDAETFAASIVDNEFAEALRVAHATGMGQAAVEVTSRVSSAKRRKSAAKFWRADNQYTGSIRDLATHSEAIMRGAHAFDVVKKGGDFETAVGRVSKFHFNYADIGGLDRTMKSVIPFWMFFSRNLVLQSEVWTRMPQKINRTYVNAVRNFSDNDGGMEPRFDYFDEMGLIQTGVRVGGSRVHAGLDLPSIRFRQDVATLFPNPTRILADSYPWFKVPVENVFNKNLFYNTEFRNEDVQRVVGKDGNFITMPRTAPGWLNNPVMTPLLQNLPGFSNIGGQLTITDQTENMLRQFPPYQRLAGLLFPAERDSQNWWPRMFSFITGIQARPNTPEMQRQVGERDLRQEELRLRRELDRQRALEAILENR